MKRKKRIMAVVLSIAMVLTSANLPQFSFRASAAVTAPAENMKDTGILTVSGDKLVSTQESRTQDGKYNGYVQSMTGNKMNAGYYKVTFKVAEGTAQDTKIFTFQPYDTTYGGWQDNIIKLSDAQYDDENDQYVAYISGDKIRDSYTTGGTLNGINISFCQAEPAVTLTGLYISEIVDPNATLSPEELRWEEEQKVVVWGDDAKTTYGHQFMQDVSVNDIVKQLGTNGSKYAFSKVKNQKITVYIKVTKCSRYSRIKISGGDLANNSVTSNKELIGIDNTTNVKENEASGKSGYKNNAHFLHAGWGTSGGYGSGMGQKESAVYMFETTSFSKGTEDSYGVRLRRMTTDVEAYICGIKFGSAGSVTVSEPDEDGNVTFTEGFDDSNVESWNKDDSDVEPKPESELRADEVKAIRTIIASFKEYKKSEILDETIWQTIQEDIENAESLIADEASLSKDIKAQRTKMENYAATVSEEMDRTATRNGLKETIDYCSSLKAADYSNKGTFDKLADAIATAQKAYDKVSDTRLNYKSARDTLEKVRVALAKNISKGDSSPKDFRILSKKEVTQEMGAGINLGNTMDGGLSDSSETGWQAYKTTKDYIKALHDAGYNTVRIPVTWGSHINDDYTIDEAWLSRVQEIVDYCVDQDMYAIINIHHDGAANHDKRGNNTPACWLDTYAQNIEKVYQKYEGVWNTIADRFKDYDEHLIFESMNEVTDAHGTATNEDDAVLNALNQLFINTVRATGSNNTKRWLAITGRFATTNAITSMPEDTLADSGELGTTRLMFAVHIYKANNNVRWSYDDIKQWQSSMSSTYKNVGNLDADMPIYVGEYGVRTKAQSGSATGYNNAERALNYEMCAAIADFYNAVPIVWDQGTGNYLTVKTEQGLFTDWNRPELKPVYDDVVFGTIRGTLEAGKSSNISTRMSDIYKSYGHAATSDNSVSKDPEITSATDIELSDTKLELKAGERKTITASPDSSRDIVLWSTADDSVATVYNGMIHAKAGGVTTVYARTQSGSVEKEIRVIVQAVSDNAVTAIKTDKAYYELTEGETATINVALSPAESEDEIIYTSSNTSVATVSGSGKITAENAGKTYIVIKAASGVSTIVAVRVKKKSSTDTVDVTLNVLYATSGLTEKSKPVTINGDGQYTLTFDVEKDLSEAGAKAGITKLEDLTSVYIRDTNTLKPVVSAATIRYDKITVNDKELTLKRMASMDADGFKNLLKDSGQLDSNDPINGWDGSAVEEVSVNSSKHSVSFTGIDNPTKISVTFTIKGMKFFPGNEKKNEATAIKSVTSNKIVIPAAGESTEIEVDMTPADTDSEVTFYSIDNSIAVVDSTKQTIDENGKVKVNVTAVSPGITTIVGITENGLKVLYTIGVGSLSVDDLDDPEDPTPAGLDGKGTETTPTAAPGITTQPAESNVPETETPAPDTSAVPQPSATAQVPGASATPDPSETAQVPASAVPEPSATAPSTAQPIPTVPVPTPVTPAPEAPKPTVGPTPPASPSQTPEAPAVVPSETPSTPASSAGIKKKQEIKAPAKIAKPIGSKGFSIGAKTTGDGKLTYKSTNTKIATVNAKGMIKVKAYGTVSIIISASATKSYKAARKVSKLTVTPKALKLTGKRKSGRRISLNWKKDKTVQGYQIIYTTDKKFKNNIKKITIKNNKRNVYSITKKIKAKETYFVKMRSYVKVSGKTIYGGYSKTYKASAR